MKFPFSTILLFGALFGATCECCEAASDIYIAQNAGGLANGTSCANAYASGFFNSVANWGTGSSQIGPGSTVHLCGTFTGAAGSTMLTAQASGSSTAPITILFETGASLTAPYWNAADGALNLSGTSYIVVDGGSPCGAAGTQPCNGVIQATANGDALSNQQSTRGIVAQPCNYCEIRNLGIYNLYVHIANGAFNNQASVNCIEFNGTSVQVHDSSFHDAGFCVFDNYTNDTSVSIFNNNLFNNEHDVVIAGANYTLASALIYGNHIHDWANWDCPSNACHHDGIHSYNGSGGGVTNMYIYNNRFDGGLGATMNAEIFLEGTAGGTPWTQSGTMYVFNNILVTSGAHSAAQLWLGSGNLLANNTVMCSGNSGDISWQNKTATGDTFTNNVENDCGYFENWSNNYQAVGSGVNFNVYGQCVGSNCWNWDETAQGGPNIDTASFASWTSQCNCDNNSKYSAAGLNLSSLGIPQTGSPAIQAATNLTTQCSGSLAPLCQDFVGAQRPSTGAWDAGAYFVGVQPPTLMPPTNLTASF